VTPAVAKAHAPREAYAVCGAASRLARARAREARLTPTEWAVLSVVEDLTVSYSRLSEAVTAGQVARLARLDATDERHTRTRRALRKLAAAGVIVWVPGSGRNGSIVSLPVPDERGPESTPSAEAPTDPGSGGRNRTPHNEKGKTRRTTEDLPSVDPPSSIAARGDEESARTIVGGLWAELSPSQRRLAADVGRDPARLRRCVEEAGRGQRPVALLTDLLRRAVGTREERIEEERDRPARVRAAAERWVRQVGYAYPEHDRLEELGRLFPALSPADRAAVGGAST
jgi:hypothetical protein